MYKVTVVITIIVTRCQQEGDTNEKWSVPVARGKKAKVTTKDTGRGGGYVRIYEILVLDERGNTRWACQALFGGIWYKLGRLG